eukprot:gene805-1053_t
MLSAVVRLVDDGILSLPQAVTTVTHNPAQATGLKDRGQIATDLRADLIQVRFVDMPQGKRHAVVRAVWREGKRREGRIVSDIRTIRSQVGFVFQQFNLVDRLPVLVNVLVGRLHSMHWLRGVMGWFNTQE